MYCVSEKSNKDYILNKDPVKILITPEEHLKFFNYSKTLNEYRDKIDKINQEDWKRIRWYINDYDFIVRDPIINRAFYKYWEMIYTFDLIDTNEKVLHCAEAPGGFIQGTNMYYNINNKIDINNKTDDNEEFTLVYKKKIEKNIYSISLNNEIQKYKLYNLPTYNKNVITKNVYITYGKDNTGDINNIDNVYYIKNKNKEFNFITADGGFDEGIEFNNKEQLHYKLIISEILCALILQKNNGNFILKMFDIFTETSCHLLYLLSLCYNNITIYKPSTSRPTNSEKYIICKNFNINEDNKNDLITFLKCIMERLSGEHKYISVRMFEKLPIDFMNNLYKINSQITFKQCSFLKKAIVLANDSVFIKQYDKILENSINKRNEVYNQWKIKYKLP